MDSNPQLLRRTHSPFVAAAAAAASSTLAVETPGHGHHHGHGHGHTSPGHSHTHTSPGHHHQHQHQHQQPHLSPLSGAHGLKPSGMSSPSILGLSDSSKALSNGLGATSSSSSSIMNGHIPFASSTAGAGAALFQTLGQEHHHHSSSVQHQHTTHSHAGHSHDHSHGHSHSHDHSSHDHSHDHGSHNHHHDHSTGARIITQAINGFQAAPEQHHHHPSHNHGHDSHNHHHGHDAHSHHAHDTGHHNHNHGHTGHDHHGHGAHDHHAHGAHDHHGHDHHAHGAHDHHHGHDHNHGHDHHGHDHGHDHHHAHHSVSYRSQLPSYSEIFGGLLPRQKTTFTWILLHSFIAVMTWLSGMGAGSLAITGLGYMLLFDAFGVLNIFISSVIHTDINMKKSTVKHPFGVQRFEILFGLFNAIFLLFIGMNMLKESLEHLMLEDDHHGGKDHGPAVRVPLFWTFIALGATLISSLGYQNHKQFCALMSTNSMASSQSTFGRSESKLLTLTRNQFTLTTLGCVAGVFLVAAFPHLDSLDKMVAIAQSVIMFYLGGPLAKVLGMIILQTTPPRALEGVEDAFRQLSSTNPAIIRIERSHVWTNTYGQLIGTLIVGVAKGSDEQAILAQIHHRLQAFLDIDGKSEGAGELTVQLVQHH